MEFKRVIWPTDLSKNAEKALPYVNSLSEKYQTEVHVLYVIEELGYHAPWYGEFDQAHIDKIHEWERNVAEKRLNEICETHLQGCPLYIRHIAIGDPATEILNLVEKVQGDLVVMATRGRKGNFDFGGVTEKVLKSAPVPVVAIPAKGE